MNHLKTFILLAVLTALFMLGEPVPAAALDAGDITWAPWQTPRDLVEDLRRGRRVFEVRTADQRTPAAV